MYKCNVFSLTFDREFDVNPHKCRDKPKNFLCIGSTTANIKQAYSDRMTQDGSMRKADTLCP